MPVSMKMWTALLLTLSLLIASSFAQASATIDKAAIDEKLAAILTYDGGADRQPLIAVEELIRQSQGKSDQRKYIERQLAALLEQATLEGKSFICKQLWSIGTAESVPAVAKLLADEPTADMACYAIGQNPSAEAGKALREALGDVTPSVQIRIINLLGDRRDTESIHAVGALVFSGDKKVGEAAVTAMGKIGGTRATRILAKARAEGDDDLKFAATDAYLRCAEDLAFDGQSEQAAAIYKELAGPREDAIFRSASIKGLAGIGSPDAVRMVIAALRDENRMMRTTAAGCVRTMRGEDATGLIVGELPTRPPAEQVLLIGALADRGDTAGLPAIIAAAKSEDAEIRKAALHAIGKLGDASSVELLVEVASGQAGEEEKTAAISSLALLSGEEVDLAITNSMRNSPSAIRPQLIEVLSDRNAIDAVPALLGESANPHSKIRRAAFKALARLAQPGDLPSLVQRLVDVQNSGGSRDAERALIAVSRKITDEGAHADVVLTALSAQKDVPVKCSLLRVLGGIANGKALDAVVSALQDEAPNVRDTAVRTLAQWPDKSAANILLEIYSNSQDQIHRLLALRGFVRLLALPGGNLPASEAIRMCRQAMRKTLSMDEKKLVLSGLGNVAHADALTLAESFLAVEPVRTEAAMAMIRIAGTLGRTDREQARTAINLVLSATDIPHLREQAEQTMRQIEAGDETPAHRQ